MYGRLIVWRDGSLVFAVSSGERAVHFTSDGHRRDIVLVLDGESWGQLEVDRGDRRGGLAPVRDVTKTVMKDGLLRTDWWQTVHDRLVARGRTTRQASGAVRWTASTARGGFEGKGEFGSTVAMATIAGGGQTTMTRTETPLPFGGKRVIQDYRLPDGSSRTVQIDWDADDRGTVTIVSKDPQGKVTDVETGQISKETTYETNAEGHTVKTETTTSTRDRDAQGNSRETVTSHSEDQANGTRTDAKSITVTDAAGNVTHQDKHAHTTDKEGNWSDTTVETDPTTGDTTIVTKSGDRDGNEYEHRTVVDKDGNPKSDEHTEKHPDSEPPKEDPPAEDPPAEPEPDPDPDDSHGRPADDGTTAPRGPGGLAGKIIADHLNKRADEGDGDENRPTLAVAGHAHHLIASLIGSGQGDSEGGLGQLTVDMRVRVPAGAVDDWGDSTDPRMNSGFAAMLDAIAAQLQSVSAGRR
ncbi:hypothetical protein F4553_005252 [Allocatelliglobosispora scoriae]|uniref:Uncharacterized protein n=1 Tax=Allocatelliglobosispora scoriae TaxID=643052 RepID=A0A841BY70_9ACTN|nr:hypothetical protein [Allocatelliglobosispora scoriae]MBB5871873.1 hypothetical protein [Allocatelliglobosispora scoriae]